MTGRVNSRQHTAKPTFVGWVVSRRRSTSLCVAATYSRRAAVVILALCVAPACAFADSVIVGSKKFTESYVLGEIAKKLVSDAGVEVEHKQGMGGTIILWQALRTGAITMYPEYTGTIGEEILKAPGLDIEAMRARLARD